MYTSGHAAYESARHLQETSKFPKTNVGIFRNTPRLKVFVYEIDEIWLKVVAYQIVHPTRRPLVKTPPDNPRRSQRGRRPLGDLGTTVDSDSPPQSTSTNSEDWRLKEDIQCRKLYYNIMKYIDAF